MKKRKDKKIKLKKSKYTIADYLKRHNFDNILNELEEIRIERNIDKINDNFDDLAECLGRDLTEFEQSAILDIVDEYTPKDDKGNYKFDMLPFDYAWTICEYEKAEKWDKIKKLIEN